MSYDINEYSQILQKLYAANVKRINEDESIANIDYIKVALLEAEQIWLNAQVLMKTKKYQQMNDDEKITLIQKDFGEFYNNFPIVSRYMICMGQYKKNAFKRMLLKSKDDQEKQTADKRDSNEDQYIIRQADYIRFLWEEYQEKTFTQKDSDEVWSQAHTLLKKEFDDFKKMYDDMEEKIKQEKLKNKKERLYEMGERIISGKQSMKEEDAKKMVENLKNILYKQRSNAMIKQLASKLEPLDIAVEGVGINEDAKIEYEEDLKQAYYKKKYKKMDPSKIMA